ncbi:hypothetical protein Bbelb_292770 [Branchiostoma belcheri]|nr:hypothetical protein Bbelb_292770 [Branchiostoma belcheri]
MRGRRFETTSRSGLGSRRFQCDFGAFRWSHLKPASGRTKVNIWNVRARSVGKLDELLPVDLPNYKGYTIVHVSQYEEVCNRYGEKVRTFVNHEVVAWNPEGRAEERSGDTAFTDGFQARGFGVEGNITFITSQRSHGWVVWKGKG